MNADASAMRTVMLLAALTLVGCRPSDPAPSHPITPYGEARTAIVRDLIAHQAATGTTVYDGAIRELSAGTCASPPCVLTAANDGSEHDPGDVALELLAKTSDRDRKLGLAVACGMCAEASMPCLCEGRACQVGDVRVEPLRNRRLLCGVVLAGTAIVPWGRSVAAMPWILSP